MGITICGKTQQLRGIPSNHSRQKEYRSDLETFAIGMPARTALETIWRLVLTVIASCLGVQALPILSVARNAGKYDRAGVDEHDCPGRHR